MTRKRLGIAGLVLAMAGAAWGQEVAIPAAPGIFYVTGSYERLTGGAGIKFVRHRKGAYPLSEYRGATQDCEEGKGMFIWLERVGDTIGDIQTKPWALGDHTELSAVAAFACGLYAADMEQEVKRK